MLSALTLADLIARVQAFLVDAGAAIFDDATVEAGVRLALQEYSRTWPLEVVGVVTPAAGKREVDISTLTGLERIVRVWFPYTAAAPEWPPTWVNWQLWWDSGSPVLFLDVRSAPTGSQVARLVYTVAHTLDDLDAATATTFPASVEGLLLLGAAGYACLSRATDLNETTLTNTTSTPNYGAIANLLLGQFRQALKKR